MKIFIYKLLISTAVIFILFQLTFGLLLKKVEKSIVELSSKDRIENIKIKIREEIKYGISKDRLLNEEDAKLLSIFFNKIKTEINNSK
jgi:hypothetical protein